MININEYNKYSPFNIDAKSRSDKELLFDQFYKKFSQLSKKIQDLMIDMSTAELVKKIVTDFRLTEENGEEIARIIRDILLGDVYYKDLENALGKRLKIDTAKAQQITNIINNQLFGPVIEEIKKIQAPLEKEYERMPKMPQKTEATATSFEEPVPEENVVDLRNI